MTGEETAEGVEYFGTSFAHIFVLGCSIFSIFWGVINAVLVKNIKISDKDDGTW